MSKKNFEPHYKAFTNNFNLVKVGCFYAGKMYYGIAKCAPEDKFDYDFGYRLAKARCDVAISLAKMNRSQEKIEIYRYYMDKFHRNYVDELEYERKLHEGWLKAVEELSLATGSVE